MADKKVSELVSATTLTLDGSDNFMIVQGGVSKKISASVIFANVPDQLVVKEPHEVVASGGALSLTTTSSLINATAGNTTYTLAAGTHGLVKEIFASSVTNPTYSAEVTVTGGVGITTATLTHTGSSVTLKNINGSWYVVSSNNATVA